MWQTVSIGAVVVAVAGWAIYTQTDLIRPAPVVEAADGPLVVEAADQDEITEVEAEAEAEAETAEAAETEEAASDEGTDEAEITSEETATEDTEQPTEEVVEEAVEIPAPAFDVVRVEADGMTVIAGTGPAGWLISILVDGEVIETVEADASGQFVAILDIGESELARVVTLSAKNADQIILSDAQVIIAPVVRQVAATEEAVEETVVEETTDVNEVEEVVETAEVTEVETAEAVEESSAPVEESTEPAEETAEAEVEVTEAEVEEAEPETASSEVASDANVEAPTETVEAEATTSASEEEPSEVTATAETTEESTQPEVVETTAEETVAEEVTEEPTPEADVTNDEIVVSEESVQASDDEPVVEVVEDSSPAVLLVEGDDVQVLQPASETPVVMDQLSISAISYSDEGAVQLSGISPAGFLRVYLNNTAVMELIVPEPGEWKAELIDVAPGVYTLRIDQVGENGEVVQRVETPFKREEPAKVIEAAQTRRPLVSVQVVQPGSTLWAISRENYGSGVLFVRIFEANKDQIRDPDLIYPGQIFDLPAPPGAKKKSRTSGQ